MSAAFVPAWDTSVVSEYEARVEPFTGLFVKDLLEPVLKDAKTRDGPLSLLDVGCGAGCGSLLAAEHGLRVTATDVSQGMVDRTRQRAEEKGLSMECVEASGEELTSNDVLKHRLGHYDFCIAAFSLIFFPDPAKGLAEIYQCLSDDGGKVMLTAWGNKEETPAFQVFQDAFRAVKPETADGGKPGRITGSPSVLKSLLEEANFQDVEIVGPVSHHLHVKEPEAFYDRFALTSPKIRGQLASLDAKERHAVKEKVLTLAEERGGGKEDGSIAIPSMAYLAYGTKRSGGGQSNKT
ncbi:Methyltransferase [Seminavis robusta]|uniref:Methyltransferase n=1 Tax=Seminavis robusta TaxID=568900 RepID=A0A9N8HH88_9STRA|nr:Methyltransferase [Seminavis robusta]|eukprot:Sro436_g142550.1 Methyltransferase (294) ;mRNA; r:12923-13804